MTALDALRPGEPGCPSELALDRLHLGELQGPAREALSAHVCACASCQARLQAREAGFDALPGVDPRRVLAGIRRGADLPRRASPLRFLAALVPVAAAVLLLALPHGVRGPVAPEGLRAKGGLTLHVFRARGSETAQVTSGDRFQAGDRLRFVVDLPFEGFVRVVGVESGGRLYTAWPLQEGLATRRPAGAGIALEGAVALDAHPGRETLYLVECPSSAGEPQCSTDAQHVPHCGAGCTEVPFVLEKGL